MSQIRCRVNECHYNRSQYCDAGSIEVGSCSAADVKSCEQTECRTFREKGGSMS